MLIIVIPAFRSLSVSRGRQRILRVDGRGSAATETHSGLLCGESCPELAYVTDSERWLFVSHPAVNSFNSASVPLVKFSEEAQRRKNVGTPTLDRNRGFTLA